jgi:hypothetical protein
MAKKDALAERMDASARLKREPLMLEAIGETVLIQELSVAARGRVFGPMAEAQIARKLGKAKVKEPQKLLDLGQFQASVVIECTLDPETEQPVFSETDRESILKFSSRVVEPIVELALKLSGISEEELDLAKKD